MKLDIIAILCIILAVLTLASTAYVLVDISKHKDELKGEKTGNWFILAIIGFVTNFFDTWGIGSFAPTQASFKFTKTSPDETVPGTLNVGDTLPVSIEAIWFLIDHIKKMQEGKVTAVGSRTLALMLVAATLGAFLGAGIVSKWNLKTVRIVLGVFLILTAIITVCRTAELGPFAAQGDDFVGIAELTGILLVVGLVCNFILGALMMVGFGLYTPCIALVSLLGMSVGAAFPIMMGSCAFLMNVSIFKFVKEGKYDRRATLMLMFPGGLGALVACILISYAFTPTVLTYIVCVVMLITASMYFRDAKKA